MRSETFWKWFEEEARPKLAGRAGTFAKMFEHLDKLDRPVTIVETGCARRDPAIEESWKLDGCSTFLFDRYVGCAAPESRVFSVDLDREAVRACCGRVSLSFQTTVTAQDSVDYLKALAVPHWFKADLLYLDSFDYVAWNPLPSAMHHHAELMAAMPMIRPDTLVVVDDSPAMVDDQNRLEVGGKGTIVAKHMLLCAADMEFCEYQTGWTNVGPARHRSDEDLDHLVARARGHVEGNRLVAAEGIYRLILGITTPPVKPHSRVAHGEACDFYARLAVQRMKFGTAADWWREALSADPMATDYRLDLIVNALMPMGNVKLARVEGERATKIAPDYWRTWHVFGGVLHMLNESEEATAAYDREIAAAPEEPDGALDRISIAIEVGDYDKARDFIPGVMATDRRGDALHCLAMIAHREHKHEEAIVLFDEAIAWQCSDIPMAHWNKSLSLHAIGRYREGWEEHTWRAKAFKTPMLSLPPRRFTVPMWDGTQPVTKEDGTRAVVHVHAEAGYGDNIAMLRFLPLIEEMGYAVHYEASPGMAEMAAYSFPTVTVMPKAPDYPGALGLKPFDYHIPIGELPHVFKIEVDSVPWRGPYIKADPILIDKWHARTWPRRWHRNTRLIGLCWSAGIREGIHLREYGMSKSVRFEDFRPLFGWPHTQILSSLAQQPDIFVSLQVGPERTERAEPVIDILPDRPSWAETAALVANLDLVITVDTAVAHLAGAMGKPVWVISRKDGMSWHFMCERPGAPWNERSPWYPSARVFRQREFDTPHFWDDVISDIGMELRSMSAAA